MLAQLEDKFSESSTEVLCVSLYPLALLLSLYFSQVGWLTRPPAYPQLVQQ